MKLYHFARDTCGARSREAESLPSSSGWTRGLIRDPEAVVPDAKRDFTLPQMRKTHPAAESPAHVPVSGSGNATWSQTDLIPAKRTTTSVIRTTTKFHSPPHRWSPGGNLQQQCPWVNTVPRGHHGVR